MGHHHAHSHGTQNIKWAFFLNLSFTIIEIIGGFLTNSLSIMSDALHDLGDSLSLGLAWYFEKVSNRRSDSKFSYGYKRFSLLAAIINSLVLIIGAIFILQSAIPRLISPQEANASGMILLAILGVIINGAAAFKLEKGHSHNQRVVYLHLLEDVLGWVAVLIGSIVMYFTNWFIIDPVLSIAITLFILFNVYKNIRSSLNIVLQGIPETIDLEKVKTSILALQGVDSLHDLHIWSMDGNRNILTVHLVTIDGFNPTEHQALKNKARSDMMQLGIDHCTIEFEAKDEECALIDC